MADLPDPVEDLWRTYWLPLITDGGQHAPSLLRIKGELFDAFHLIDRARAVYRHVTGGATDDLTLEASVVCELADRLVARRGATLPAPEPGEPEG